MDKRTWKTLIVEQMKQAKLYNETCDGAITALSEILEQRDLVMEEYVASGGKAAVIHTLDRGAENMKVNPLLKVWMDLNAQALTFWNSLGLTTKSYRSMTGTFVARTEGVTLEQIVADLGI